MMWWIYDDAGCVPWQAGHRVRTDVPAKTMLAFVQATETLVDQFAGRKRHFLSAAQVAASDSRKSTRLPIFRRGSTYW